MGIQPSAELSVNRRRSNRIGLSALVGMSGHDRQKFQFTMPAKASSLNRYGAAVQLPRELEVGSTVVVENKYGAQLSARVVGQVNLLENGVRCYGIEFAEQDEKAKDFWGIAFPTA